MKGIIIFLFFCNILLAAFNYELLFAQERPVNNENRDGAVIIKIEGDIGEPSPKGDMIFINNEDGSNIVIDERKASFNRQGKNDAESEKNGARAERRSERAGQRQRSREMNMMNSQETAFMKGTEATEQKQGTPEVKKENMAGIAGNASQRQQQADRAPSADKLQSYMDSIVKKNLFLPLGSGKEGPKQSYALTAVISNASNERKAIIEQIGSNTGFYVSEGESFAGEAKVLNIQEKAVKVSRSGEELMLKLGIGTQGGEGRVPREGGQRGNLRSPDGNRRAQSRQDRAARGSDDFNADNIPDFVKKMLGERGISIEELKNNPDLREKLKSEFMKSGMGEVPMPVMK